jgi:hypothetical protein
VEGFPDVLVQAEPAEPAEIDLTNALGFYLRSLQDQAVTRRESDDLQTVRVVRLFLTPRLC